MNDEKELEMSWKEMGAIEEAIASLRKNEGHYAGTLHCKGGAVVMWNGPGPVTIRYPAGE